MQNKNLKLATLAVDSFATELKDHERETLKGGSTPACGISVFTATLLSGYVLSNQFCPTDEQHHLTKFGNTEVPRLCPDSRPICEA